MNLADIDWTTVAAVVTAVGALGALWYTAKTDRRSFDQQRREQASKVGVWVEHATYDTTTHPPRYSDFEVVVYNGSEAPIHDVRVDRLPVPWSRNSDYVEAASVSVILPRTEAPWMPFAGFEGEMPVVSGIPESPPLRLYFTDNAAVRWVRYPDGRLDEERGKR